MKIFVFANDKEWTEYNYEDFDGFFDDIVQRECAFKFGECTEWDINVFLENLEEKSTCLDDCDYYSFSCNRLPSDTIEDVYIFNDLRLYTLDELIALRQRQLNYYKELKSKI
jgi:hypothetical protein